MAKNLNIIEKEDSILLTKEGFISLFPEVCKTSEKAFNFIIYQYMQSEGLFGDFGRDGVYYFINGSDLEDVQDNIDIVMEDWDESNRKPLNVII